MAFALRDRGRLMNLTRTHENTQRDEAARHRYKFRKARCIIVCIYIYGTGVGFSFLHKRACFQQNGIPAGNGHAMCIRHKFGG